MAEYIEREGLINKICSEKCHSEYGRCQKGLHDDKIFLCVCDFIMWQPAADVAPVRHGRWRFCGSDKWNDAYECSECGNIAMDDSNYCPNCGAKMIRGNDNG